MGDFVHQKMQRGQEPMLIKQERSLYNPAHTSQQLYRGLNYPEVRVAPCFRTLERPGFVGPDLPLDNKPPAEKSMGLRHFSTKVCEKVKEKGRTNYNQVADELVAEYFAANNMNSEEFLERQRFDQKNIRRRVYDALNVLLAMNIIRKRKKDIDWVGLPVTKAGEIKRLEEEKAKITESIRRKKENIQELIVQLVAYKSLVWKNREMERLHGRPPENCILYLPFVIISTSKKSEFLFNFDQPFEVHDDFEALKRLGYSYGLEHNTLNPDMMEHIDEFIPPALRGYLPKILNGEMSDWESRTRSSQPVQYVIRDVPPVGRKMTTMVDQHVSDHSSDGSYSEITQPLYTVPSTYTYTVPVYESETGDEIEVVETPNDYQEYSSASGSDSYEGLNRGAAKVLPTATVSENVVNVVNAPAYAEVMPSSSKNFVRVANTKTRVCPVPKPQDLQKQVQSDEGAAYTHNVNPKRAKIDDCTYND